MLSLREAGLKIADKFTNIPETERAKERQNTSKVSTVRVHYPTTTASARHETKLSVGGNTTDSSVT